MVIKIFKDSVVRPDSHIRPAQTRPSVIIFPLEHTFKFQLVLFSREIWVIHPIWPTVHRHNIHPLRVLTTGKGKCNVSAPESQPFRSLSHRRASNAEVGGTLTVPYDAAEGYALELVTGDNATDTVQVPSR